MQYISVSLNWADLWLSSHLLAAIIMQFPRLQDGSPVIRQIQVFFVNALVFPELAVIKSMYLLYLLLRRTKISGSSLAYIFSTKLRPDIVPKKKKVIQCNLCNDRGCFVCKTSQYWKGKAVAANLPPLRLGSLDTTIRERDLPAPLNAPWHIGQRTGELDIIHCFKCQHSTMYRINDQTVVNPADRQEVSLGRRTVSCYYCSFCNNYAIVDENISFLRWLYDKYIAVPGEANDTGEDVCRLMDLAFVCSLDRFGVLGIAFNKDSPSALVFKDITVFYKNGILFDEYRLMKMRETSFHMKPMQKGDES